MFTVGNVDRYIDRYIGRRSGRQSIDMYVGRHSFSGHRYLADTWPTLPTVRTHYSNFRELNCSDLPFPSFN